MKHILILISTILLSSPLFGQSKKSGLLYIWENGSRYVGEWKDGKKHGQGTLTYPNLMRIRGGTEKFEGMKYVGEWKDDKYHGQGTWFGKGEWKGQKYVGEYKDGKEWNGKLYDKNGNIIGKYVNGNYRTP